MTNEAAGVRPGISDEALGWVGREWQLPGEAVTASGILRHTSATGDESPLYRDPEVAAEFGCSAIVAPPLMYMALTRPIVPLAELTIDGVTNDRRPPVGAGRAVAGDISIEFVRPLQVGDQIVGYRRLISLEDKVGKSGQLVVANWETEYRDQEGRVVIREHSSLILY